MTKKDAGIIQWIVIIVSIIWLWGENLSDFQIWLSVMAIIILNELISMQARK